MLRGPFHSSWERGAWLWEMGPGDHVDFISDSFPEGEVGKEEVVLSGQVTDGQMLPQEGVLLSEMNRSAEKKKTKSHATHREEEREEDT